MGRKEELTAKYKFKPERLHENAAGEKNATEKQVNYISYLTCENDESENITMEVLEMFRLWELPHDIDNLLMSQAMFLIGKLRREK